MAIFEKEDSKNNSSYIALSSKANDGEEGQLIAFISPVKGVKPEILVEKLVEMGLNVELRTSKGDIVDFEL